MSQVIPFIPRNNYELTELDRLLYSFRSAARILDLNTEDIAALTPQPENCLVEFNNKPWQAVIPKQEFVNLFISDRRAKSRVLIATKHLDNKNKWTVWNEEANTRYEVTVYRDKVVCTCPDWDNQSLAFGHTQVCCKHCYSVLAQLGYGSLKDYLKAWQENGALSKLQRTMNRKT